MENNLEELEKHLKMLNKSKIECDKNIDNAFLFLKQEIEQGHFVEQQISAVQREILRTKNI